MSDIILKTRTEVVISREGFDKINDVLQKLEALHEPAVDVLIGEIDVILDAPDDYIT